MSTVLTLGLSVSKNSTTTVSVFEKSALTLGLKDRRSCQQKEISTEEFNYEKKFKSKIVTCYV